MWSLPDIKILNARAVAEATKLKREAKRKKKPGCQVGGCTEQAIYSDFWFDIFSPDPKGVVHTCEEHNTTDDPDFFFCESCRRIVVDHYTWERYQVQVGQETLCLTCAAARHFAHPDHWINPCEVQEVTLAPGKGLEALFDRESGIGEPREVPARPGRRAAAASGYPFCGERGVRQRQRAANQRAQRARHHPWVGRLRLLKLSAKLQAMLARGEIEAGVAELLSKFPGEALQGEACKELSRRFHNLKECSFREAKEILSGLWPALASAPWKQGAGISGCETMACSLCPKNSLNMPDLADLHKKPVCTDSACYGAKLKCFCGSQVAQLTDAGREVVEVHFCKYNERILDDKAYDRADQVKYDLSDKGQSWKSLLKGTGYHFPVAVSPAGEVVELVKISEARAQLLECGKIKPGKGAGGALAGEERKAVIARNKQAAELEKTIGESLAQAAGKLSDHDALALVVSVWLRNSRLRFLETSAGLKVDRYATADAEQLFPAVKAMDTGLIMRCLVADHCQDSKGAWQRWENEKLEDVLGVSRQVIGNRLEVMRKAEAEADAKGGNRGLTAADRVKVIAQVKARWAKVLDKEASKTKKGKTK